jgi:hypothetical protein
MYENVDVSEVCSFLKSCVQFLVKCVLFGEAKGRQTYRTCVSHLSKGRHAYRTRVSHLIKERHTLWRHVSLILNMHTQKKALQIILHRNDPCTGARGAHGHGYAKRICANSHPVARHNKHRVEHKLSEIFELFGLARILKLVSITSSRRGGTKLLYHVVHV